MGLAEYYRRFIEGFSKNDHPISSLLKKIIKFEWTPKCEDISHFLKEFITSAPILEIVDPNVYLVVCTYACKEGLGGVHT